MKSCGRIEPGQHGGGPACGQLYDSRTGEIYQCGYCNRDDRIAELEELLRSLRDEPHTFSEMCEMVDKALRGEEK